MSWKVGMHDSRWNWLPVTKLLVLLCLAVLAAPHAIAATELAWAPSSASNRDIGAWRQPVSTTLVVRGTSASTGWYQAQVVPWSQVTDAHYVWICRSDRPVGSTVWCSGNEGFVPRAQVNIGAPPAPVCPAQPAPVTRNGQCPTGTTGPSWTQTSSWSTAPYPTCWVQGPFLPELPTPNTCLAVGPPGRAEALRVYVTFDTCHVGLQVRGATPFRLEGRRKGASEWVSSPLNDPKLFCADFGIDEGAVVLVEFRMCNVGGCGPPSGAWPLLRFNVQDPVIEPVIVEYTIIKNPADTFTFSP